MHVQLAAVALGDDGVGAGVAGLRRPQELGLLGPEDRARRGAYGYSCPLGVAVSGWTDRPTKPHRAWRRRLLPPTFLN